MKIYIINILTQDKLKLAEFKGGTPIINADLGIILDRFFRKNGQSDQYKIEFEE